MRIWVRAYLESMLMSPHGPTKIAACRTAFIEGFDVDEISELSGIPVWRVRQVLLGDAVNRTTDE